MAANHEERVERRGCPILPPAEEQQQQAAAAKTKLHVPLTVTTAQRWRLYRELAARVLAGRLAD